MSEQHALFDPTPASPGGSVRLFVLGAYQALRTGLRSLVTDFPTIEIVGDGSEPPDSGDADLLLVAVTPGLPAAAVPDDMPAVLMADWRELAPLRGDAPRGFLQLDAGPGEVAAAVHAVAAGLSVYSREAASALPESSTRVQAVEIEPLTPREREVLDLVALGLPNKGIALRLGISEHTAKFHVGAVLSKLGAASRAEAITIAVRGGVLSL